MALKLTIQTAYGVPAEYHRILRINSNIEKPTDTLGYRSDIIIQSYLNEETRLKGNIPLRTITIQTDKAFNEMESAYEYIKTLPEFIGSEDLIITTNADAKSTSVSRIAE